MPYQKRTKKIFISEIPKLLSEWDFDKNNDLGIKPECTTSMSGRKVWWKCGKGHSWESIVYNRFRGRGCPYCAGQYPIRGVNDLQTVNPVLAMEWDYEKNKGLTPGDVMPGSDRKVWWICKKGHSWESPIGNRSQGKGCPYCAGRHASIEHNLLLIYPKLCEEWNYEQNHNNTPENFLPYSGKKVWWKCRQCGCEWEAKIIDRAHDRHGCPSCYKVRRGRKTVKTSLAANRPELLLDWDYEKNNIDPNKVFTFTKLTVWWKCHSCGHEWQSSVHKRSVGGKCPVCSQNRRRKSARPRSGRRVRQYTLDGEFVKEFPSIAAAMRKSGITSISQCCYHISKSAGGYSWRFTDECEDDWRAET